jgi:hypothetical protein
MGLSFSDYQGQPRIKDTAGAGYAPDPAFADVTWQDDGQGGETLTDEWGLLWRRITGRSSRGEVIGAPLETWADLDSYRLPTLDDPARYEPAARAREEHPDQYLLGGIVGCSFNQARYLRRMDQYLLDCAAEPEQVRRLNRMVNDIAVAQVDIYADLGADGVFFCEDWGIEDRLLVSPRMWESLFRPDFERLIGRAHERGLTVWMHCCGYIRDIIPSLADLGMDVLQLDQPELSGLAFLADYGDRLSYWCPVDIQKVLPRGNQAEIESRAREMFRVLGAGGGFLGMDYGDDRSIGTQPLWQHWVYEVWRREGVYR